MNELLQQFVVETRELIGQASQELETLRQSPQAAEELDAVLRVFHTLKGGAGIVEFPAMEHTMHAAEGVLSAARDGRRALTEAGFAQCLAYLDQALQWLDIIDETGELPGNADREAADMIGSFGQGLERSPPDRKDHEPTAAWLEDIANRHPEQRAKAVSAVRFVPADDSFHHAEDPLARMLSLPGLLAMECAPNQPWKPLEFLDPFVCNLTLTALSAAPLTEVLAHLKGHTGECDFLAATSVIVQGLSDPLPAIAVDVIESQRSLLNTGTLADFVGRTGSAGLVAANALRYYGRTSQAEALARATERSLRERSAQPLQQALAELFTMPPRRPDLIPRAPASGGAAARTVRVDAERVDALVRLAGELTVMKNAIGHVARLATAGDASVPELLGEQQASLERLVGELQSSVLAMRVQPLRMVLQRFHRLVREMATSSGKSVHLTVEGDRTEADKAIVEMLFEPLLHLVRNAIDHGVESPKARAAMGKPVVANLQIRAERLSDQIVIEVRDDGAGIDVARVAEVATARGIVTQEQLHTMTEADIIDLVFAPGFSTASEITQVSGRGVGMDAVRRAVERVGGKVSIASRSGEETAVKLSVPFSVMMTHVMTVEVGGQVFGLPLEAVVETARVPTAAIEQVGAARAVVLRNRTVPLVDLATLIGAEAAPPIETDATVIVVGGSGGWGGIRVDRIGERLSLILKPLDGLLAGTPGISGTTLLGDGRVLLVLDVGELLQ